MTGLQKLVRLIDNINKAVGYTAMWLAVIMALVQFAVVILRYVFSTGFIFMQESIWYMHGMLFMMGAGYTLLRDGHVRVDVFYREASARFRALVDLFGALFFLIPVSVATFVLSYSYVLNAWRILEGSTEVSGLPLIFALKTFIWVFAISLFLQGIALALRAILCLGGGSDGFSPSPARDEGPARMAQAPGTASH